MTRLPSLLEQKKAETAAAIAVLKSLLNNPDDFSKLDALGASDILAGRLTTLEQRLAAIENSPGGVTFEGDIEGHYHSSDRNLLVSTGKLPLANNSDEVLNHVNNIGQLNPHNISYLILGADIGGITLTNSGNATKASDIPNLQQVQALIDTALAYNDLSAYEPAFVKNTAFNKNFGNTAGTVAEGNHTHNYFDYLDLTAYEPVIENKGTAFNKNFGSTADTVAEGNHIHNELATVDHNHDGDYAPLVNGVIPLDKIPDTILGQVKYQGTWNAASNVPILPAPIEVKGHYYVVNTDGVYSTIAFEKGDWIISDGTKWDIVKNTDAVRTVFGRIGDIEPIADDYAAFYEAKFTKNTAFNKNFGNTAGTIAEGNHTHDDLVLNDHNHDELYEPKNINIQAHITDTVNPHNVTAEQIGAEPAFVKETGFNLPLGTEAGTVAEGNHAHDFVFEDMKTAFNKDFGTTADTVAEGNHNHNKGGTLRPLNPMLYEPFFDANIGKPIWFNGASWVDAMGNVV